MKLEKYRKTMNEDVLRSWAVDAQKMLDNLQAENEALKSQLEEARQEIASLQQCDCIIRDAE